MTAFTENQIKAMNERNCNLLVSASAGSGKTTVLISRVVNLILGKDTTPDGGRVDYKGEKASLDNMVICTYTRAAAADMRDKLQTALIAEEEKGNKTASEQLELLPSAEISTIHSWCQRLLKNYFYAVGLDPAFDLLDERESVAMLNETIDEVIDARIEKSEENFVTLYEILMSKRSDFALKEILGRIYTFSRAQADPERYLSETAFFGVDNPEVIEQEYKKSVERFMARYRAIFTDLLDKCEKYGLNTRIKQLTSAIAYTNGNADKIENKGTNKIPELIPLDEEVEAVVKKFREKIKSIKENGELPPANNRKFVEQIVSMVQEVDERFSRKKQRKAKLDYSDLEHYTVKLLKTEYADEIRKRYRYVFVDEYQDVNPLQEQIILALTGVNQFMVGDVKQSIYAFRMCDPTIFLNKQKRYDEFGFEPPLELNDNFRSQSEILDFANEVFDEVMTEDFGGINYKEKARLNAGLNEHGGAISLFAIKSAKTEERAGVYSVAENIDIETVSDLSAEVDAVVNRIGDLVSGRATGAPVDPSSIAVLYSSRSARVGMIYEKLRRLNISASIKDDIKFTSVKQIGRLCKFLKYILDERDDIALLASLKSPAGDISDEELVKIRQFDGKEKSFNALVKNYAQNNGDEIALKLRDFLAYADECRQFSYTVNAGELIGKIVADKAWFKYIFALPDAKLNADTLNSFLEFAVNSTYGESLKTFVDYMEQENLDYKRPPSANAVKIMTIHSSKGLEFEYVFLIDASRNFNHMDATSSVIRDDKYGLCLENFDELERKKNKNKLRLVASEKLVRADKEERARLLYVALTRPKKELYVFAKVEDKDPLLKGNAVGKYEDYSSAKSFFDWLRPLYAKHGFEIIDGTKSEEIIETDEKTARYAYAGEDFSKELREYLTFSKKVERAVVKKSATAIMMDEAEENEIKVEYIAGEGDDRAIEIGNAYHKAMEIISFDAPFNSEWDRIKGGFNIEKLVDKEKLRTAHKVVGEFVKGKKWLKEQQFMYKNGENMLVQGIIDLLVIDGDEFVVVDYKTSKVERIETGIYDAQLKVYCDACAKILNAKPRRPLIYSFNAGKFI